MAGRPRTRRRRELALQAQPAGSFRSPPARGEGGSSTSPPVEPSAPPPPKSFADWSGEMRQDREARLANRDHALMLREMSYETSKRERALQDKQMEDHRERWSGILRPISSFRAAPTSRPEPDDSFLFAGDPDLDLEEFGGSWAAPALLALGLAGFLLHAYATSEAPSETADSRARA